MSLMTKDDYTPRFRIGDRVYVYSAGNGRSPVYEVTDRKITRTVKRCDTYYTLALVTGDRTGTLANEREHAWEWGLEHASLLVAPMEAAARVERMFSGDRPAGIFGPSSMSATVTTSSVVVRLWFDAMDTETCLSAPRGFRGQVELIGEWSWTVTRSGQLVHHGKADNVGAALVDAYNATHKVGPYAPTAA